MSGGAARIAVALSGGGYRAAAFSAGVLLYLLDSGQGDRIAAVSSVSGGSITNAYFARRVLNVDADARVPYWQRAAGLLAFLARRDIISPRRMAIFASAVALVAGFGVALVVRTGYRPGPAALCAGIAAALVFWVIVFAVLFLQLRRSLELAAEWLLSQPGPGELRRLPMSLARTAIRYWWLILTLRFGRAIEQTAPRMTRLAEIDAAYQPVFCCTDLATGSHFYLSTSFVAGVAPSPRQPLGSIDLSGTAPTLPIATAVAASAAFPGVFRPTTVESAALGLPLQAGLVDEEIVLADGGLFDNFGVSILDAWINGTISRSVLGDLGPPPDAVVVVDSGQPSYRRSRRMSFFGTVFRSLDIVHQANSLSRRQEIRRLLRANGRRGSLVSIADDPYEVAEDCADDARKADILAWLASSTPRHGLSRAGWRALAQQRSPAVPTNLRKLGAPTTAQLVLHGYVAAMARTTAELGWKPPASELLPENIAELCEQPFIGTFRHRLAWVLSGGTPPEVVVKKNRERESWQVREKSLKQP